MTRSPYQPATPVSVKICGIASPADYDACKAAGAAFVGLVFFPRSPRHLSLPAASAIADHAEAGNGGPARVALTVDMDDATLDAVVAAADAAARGAVSGVDLAEQQRPSSVCV